MVPSMGEEMTIAQETAVTHKDIDFTIHASSEKTSEVKDAPDDWPTDFYFETALRALRQLKRL